MEEERTSELPRLNTGKRRGYMARLIFNGATQAGVVIVMALLMRDAFDELINGAVSKDISTLLPYLLGFSSIIITGACLRWLERIDAEKLGQDYIFDLRQQLFAHMSKLPLRVLQKRSRGGTMLRFVGDLSALRQWISLGVARLAVATVTTIGTLLVLAYINIMLCALVGALLLIASIAMLLLGRRLEQASRNSRKHRSRLATNISEKISAMAVVQAFGQRQREIRRLKKQSNALRDSMIQRASHIGQLRAVIEALIGFASTGVIILGAWAVSMGQATQGTVIAAMMIVGMLAPPLRDLGRVHEYWRGAKVSREKIVQFLHTPGQAQQQNSTDLDMNIATDIATNITTDITTDITGDMDTNSATLEFKNICLGGIINNFSHYAKAGERIALIGPNGAGKSTLFAMVARLLDPDSGQILINGQDITRCSLHSIRASIGMVSPDLPLLRGSIERNLKYRFPQASEQQIEQTTRFCAIDNLADVLPSGMRTRITEGGLNLSVGQRARLTLARALLGSPPVLLLDEADANLDSEAVGLIDKVLASYPGTILMITHRPHYLERVDQVWQLGPPDNQSSDVSTPADKLKNGVPATQLQIN